MVIGRFKTLLRSIRSKSATFAVLGLSIFFSLGALGAECKKYLEVQQGAVRMYKNASEFSVEVPSHAYSFDASLNKEGVLSVAAFLSFSEFGVRSHLQGKELYREMIEHFGVERIKKIKGVWVDGSNYERFFELREKGYSDDQAALNTWSGQQARRYGFGKVLKVEIQHNRVLQITTVYVEFVREVDQGE